MSLNLKIVSPERTLFSGDVDCVFLPGVMGRFEILEHHAPIISSLQAGQIVYRQAGKDICLDIAGGFVEVIKDDVSICVEE